MAATVNVNAGGDFFRIGRQYREAGRNDLARQLDRGGREAGKVVENEIAASTDTYIPQGFQRRFKQALDTKTELRNGRERRITVVVGARGKGRRRHVKEMNEGRLRRPVYGRTRRLKAGGRYVPAAHQNRIVGNRYRNPWEQQRIRPGLVDEPAARAMPRAKQKIDDALARTVAKLGRAG